MTTFVLLTGAGFSRNWGAWLADEVFEYLLGDKDLDREMRKFLWDTRRKGFEEALTRLQGAKRKLLETIVAGMLNKMDGLITTLIQTRQFEFSRIAVSRFPIS
jgi:hypothetical protein